MDRSEKLANRKNYGDKRALSTIEYIVVHYTANDGDSATANANYFANNLVGASAHYFVDDNNCIRSVPDDYVAWAVGGNKYPGTAGGSQYGKCTNANSLSVEMCDTVKNGTIYPTEKTMTNTAEIVKEKMQQYNIPIERVIRHYDVTGKQCPAYFVNDAEWQKFKARLSGGWQKDDKGWWYKNPDGSYPKEEWKVINGQWYRFGADGYMLTGWQKVYGKWYYMNASGAMQIGWQLLGNIWYYFNASGAMLENQWLKLGNNWYWLKPGGYMAKNEILSIAGKKYAFLDDGHMAVSDANGVLR